MEEFRLDFLFERLMAPLELSEMALQGHSTNPFLCADVGDEFRIPNSDDKEKLRQFLSIRFSDCHALARKKGESSAGQSAGLDRNRCGPLFSRDSGNLFSTGADRSQC